MSKPPRITEVAKAFDWNKVYKLPYYYLVSDPDKFLLVAVYAKQRPIGVLREEHGQGWYVLFEASVDIKYIDKYIEDYDFSEKKWNELRESMNTQQGVYYGLLKESERNKKEDE